MGYSEWKKYRLKDICEKIASGATPTGGKENYLSAGEYALIRSQNVLDFAFSYNGLAFINEEQANKLKNVTLVKDDVLLNITGDSVARVCQVPFNLLPARVNQHVAIIRPNKGILDNSFLKYYLLNPAFKSHLLNLSSVGATRNAITKGMIEDLDIVIPNSKTQNKIACILSSLDDKIELNRQTNQTLEAIAQTLFKEMCVPNGGELPEGWKLGKVSEVCEVNKNTINKKNDFFEWIDYVEISEVSKGIIGHLTRYLTGEEPSRAKRKLTHGDTVLSTVRPDRGSYFLSVDPLKTDIVSTGFAVFTPTKVPFSFLYLFLIDEANIKYYGHLANGGAYPAINPNVIMNMNMVIPNEKVLDEFHRIVEPLLLKFYENENENKILSTFRDILLPKLMKGEIEI